MVALFFCLHLYFIKNNIMKIGNTSFNVEALATVTKEEFIESNRGIVFDVENVAKQLSKHFKNEYQFERKAKRKKK